MLPQVRMFISLLTFLQRKEKQREALSGALEFS